MGGNELTPPIAALIFEIDVFYRAILIDEGAEQPADHAYDQRAEDSRPETENIKP